MTAVEFARWLRQVGACQAAREWAKGKTARKAWTTCGRGDWLLWWAATVGVRREDMVLAACAAERWTRGKATIEEVRSASASAYAAATACASDSASASAYAAGAPASARRETLRQCADLVRAQIPWAAVEKATRADAKRRTP